MTLGLGLEAKGTGGGAIWAWMVLEVVVTGRVVTALGRGGALETSVVLLLESEGVPERGEGTLPLPTSLPLTTTMVNPKIPKNSNKNPTLPPGLQDSSQHAGESPDSLNLLSRTSSRAGKRGHSRGRPQTRRIARRSSRGVSA